MADILIPNMEMPKDEGVFIIIDCNGTIQKQIGKSGKKPIYRLEDKATAIQLPDHGRLIDADELARTFEGCCSEIEPSTLLYEIDDAPTIVEASK